MPRVKRGTTHVKKRRKLLKAAKGYKWGRKKSIRLAKTAVTKAGAHAFVDRRKKKRVMRRLWQTRLNAAVRQHDMSYSKFIDALKKHNIGLDRKVLSEIAQKQPDIFAKIVAQVKK
ncbi:MAG: 50S ribosomal protein L20 [Candidatus Komeilibacteria bacterium]